MLTGVSKYLFTSLALAVVLALFASYVVAMTVVPLFCAKFIRLNPGHAVTAHLPGDTATPAVEEVIAEQLLKRPGLFQRIVIGFNRLFERLQDVYEGASR